MIGMTIVSICYFLVNLSFFSILSNDEIVSAQAVALVSAGLDFVYHSRQGCVAVANTITTAIRSSSNW